jgi:uncharacterized protein
MVDTQSRFWPKFEITSVVITGLMKFVLMDWLELRFLYISIAVLFWICYGVFSYRTDAKRFQKLGINKTKFTTTIRTLLPILIILTTAFIVIGIQRGTSVLNWTIIPILVIYPIWGAVQQYIIVGLLAGNLNSIKKPELSKWLIIAITSVVFGVVHFPHIDLVIATTAMAIVYTSLYLRGYNLIVMGVIHGWIGAVFFYTIMGRDAWAEVFGKLT